MAWLRNTKDGDPEAMCQTHPAAHQPPEPLGAPLVIQSGRTGKALRAPGDFRRPPCTKMVGPMLPLTSAFTLAHSSARRTAVASVLLAYWGLTLTLNPNP